MRGCARALVAPPGRPPLSADARVRWVRSGVAHLPAQRATAGEMSGPAALRSAGAMVSLNAPSRRACDPQRAAGHGGTLSGLERAPCDTPMRASLAAVSPESLRPVLQRVVRPWPRGQARAPRAWREDHSWLGRAGTGAGAANTLHGASGRHPVHRHGRVTDAPQRWGAAMVPPDGRAGMPWRPEPLVPPEGTDHQAGARHAAQRCMTKGRQDHPQRHGRVTADSRRSQAPPWRPCKRPLGMTSWGSTQASLPCGSLRGRRRSPRGVSPLLRDPPAPPVWGSACAWSLPCRARPRTRPCGALSAPPGTGARPRGRTAAGCPTCGCPHARSPVSGGGAEPGGSGRRRR